MEQSLLDILDLDAPKIPVAVPVKAPVLRHFYRCADCLTVAATEEKLSYRDKWGGTRYGKCGACGGELDYMGQVERQRLVTKSIQSVCDHRCTGALGPHCDCKCGGQNHGSQAVCEVSHDAGGIPKLAINPRARFLAEHYRKLLDSARQAIATRYGATLEAKQRGEYLSNSEYVQFCRGAALLRELHIIRELRTHAGRNKRLEAVIRTVLAG